MTDPHKMEMIEGKIRAVYTDSAGDEYVFVNGERIWIAVTDVRGNRHAGLIPDVVFPAPDPGIYGNDDCTYAVADSGRIWLVQAPDVDLSDGPQEIDALPEGVDLLDASLCHDLDLEGVE